jgi:glycosyltransferase involved in cell wall biosynthesis
MKALIFELGYGGHVLQYVKSMLPAIKAVVDSVTVVTSDDAVQSAEFASNLGPFLNGITIKAAPWKPTTGDTFGGAKQRTRLLIEAVESCRPDHIYIPTADGVVQTLGLFNVLRQWRPLCNRPIEALMLRGGFAYRQDTVVAALKARASHLLATIAPVTSLHVQDPLVWEKCRGGMTPAIRLFPDPVEESAFEPREDTLRRLGLDPDKRYFVCVGLLGSRKGTDLLVDAFAAAKLEPQDCLLLAGPHSEGLARMLSGPHRSLVAAGRVVSINRYLPPEELQNFVAIAHCMCAPHPQQIGSVSSVLRALSARRPVLGADNGWMGAMIPLFQLGWTCDVTDTAVFAAAIEQAVRESGQFALSQAAERLRAFHTPENFGASWALELRARLGLPPDDSLKTWPWVLEACEGRIGNDASASPA